MKSEWFGNNSYILLIPALNASAVGYGYVGQWFGSAFQIWLSPESDCLDIYWKVVWFGNGTWLSLEPSVADPG